MNYYLNALKKYAVFNGRMPRKEYWMFALFNLTIYIIFDILDKHLGTKGTFTLLYSLAIIVPNIAAGVRRLHDINRSGWWMLYGIIPLLDIVLIIFLVMDSQPGDNQYGPNPKGVVASV